MQHFEYDIDPACVKKRLDVFLTQVQSDISRSYVQKLIEGNQVQVNNSPARSSYKLKVGDHVEFTVPDPTPLDVKAEAIALHIVYEDKSLLVIDKPAGMVVHPAPGHYSGTLVNALLHHCSDLAGIGGVERPGIVHRLDKDTSGLVAVAKTDAAHQSLSKQFKDREIQKVYLALVAGRVKNSSGTINSPIGRHRVHRKKMASNIPNGREALTRYELIERFDKFSYLRLYPKTGRTHQIRVHLASIGHPILGDTLYGGNTKQLPRQALHAHILQLKHPHTGEMMTFSAPLPPDMADYLTQHHKPAPQ